MKHCSVCSTSGLFLKLKNGLCKDCYTELKSFENQYEEILIQIATPSANKIKIMSSINMLMIKLRKYDNVSLSIKSSDCEKLLSNLNVNQLNTTPNIISPILNTLETKSEIPTKTTTYSPLPNNIERHIENIDLGNPTVDLSSKLIEKTINDSVDNINNTNINNTYDNIVIDTPIIPPTINEPIKKPLSPDFYNEAQSIIKSLTSNNLSIDELAFYTFLFKNDYYNTLHDHSITTIDDIDLDSLISNNLKKLSFNLNTPENELFGYYNYVALSIQTTGIHASTSDIIEIAAFKIRYGKIEDTFHTLVNPMKTIGINIEKNTSITNEDLRNAPTIDTVLKDFYKFAEDLKLISHNINFTLGFINYFDKKLFNKEFTNESECTMNLYRKRYKKFYGDPPQKFQLSDCCHDILTENDIEEINEPNSLCISSALGTYKIYEILKSRYK